MRDIVNRPDKSFAFLRAGTALAVAAAFACALVPAAPASAFELFGMKFFESDEEEAIAVIDPVAYTLTLDAGSGDEALKEKIEGTALL
jgi:translocation and assembly module TamA